MGQHSCCNQQKVKRGLWSPEEDEKLIRYISTYGYGCWSEVPEKAGAALLLSPLFTKFLKNWKERASAFLFQIEMEKGENLSAQFLRGCKGRTSASFFQIGMEKSRSSLPPPFLSFNSSRLESKIKCISLSDGIAEKQILPFSLPSIIPRFFMCRPSKMREKLQASMDQLPETGHQERKVYCGRGEHHN